MRSPHLPCPQPSPDVARRLRVSDLVYTVITATGSSFNGLRPEAYGSTGFDSTCAFFAGVFGYHRFSVETQIQMLYVY